MVGVNAARKLCGPARRVLCLSAHRHSGERRDLRKRVDSPETRYGRARLRIWTEAGDATLPHRVSAGGKNADYGICGYSRLYSRTVWNLVLLPPSTQRPPRKFLVCARKGRHSLLPFV